MEGDKGESKGRGVQYEEFLKIAKNTTTKSTARLPRMWEE